MGQPVIVHASQEIACHLTWHVVANPVVPVHGALYALAAVAPNDIWAVGTFIEHWDGNVWTVYPSPGPFVQSAVGIVSPNDIWATSTQIYSSPPSTVHWDGTQWNIVSDIRGNSMAALASDDVWTAENASQFFHWNGTLWQTIPGPDHLTAERGVGHAADAKDAEPQFVDPTLVEGMAGLGTNDVWAVGGENVHPYGFEPRVWHWNGSDWTSVIQNVVSFGNLTDLRTFSPTNIWMTGSAGLGVQRLEPLLMHTDGENWAVIPTPFRKRYSAGFRALDGSSGNDLYAAGIQQTVRLGKHYHAGPWQPLIAHWDGKETHIQPLPQASTSDTYLDDVAMVSSTDVWAVGYSTNVDQTASPLMIHGGTPCTPYVPKETFLATPPAGGAVSTMPPILHWQANPLAQSYQVQVWLGTGVGQPLIETETGDVFLALNGLVPNRQWYVWRVRACNTSGCGKWSKTRSFLYAP